MAALTTAEQPGDASALPRFRLGYRPELDGLRAIAVTLVVLHHTGDLVVPGVIGWLAPGGYLGVDVFFVLSGFLITALLLGEWQGGGISWGRFLARRALRLLPALVAFLGVFLVVSPLTGLHTFRAALSSVTWALTYVQNWPLVGWTRTSEVGQTWSLAIEAQFYIGWSLVVLCVAKLHLRRGMVGIVAIGGVVATALWRAHDYGRDHNWLRVYVRTFDRTDSLLVGCVVAVAVTQGWLRGASSATPDSQRKGRRDEIVRQRWRAVQLPALAILVWMAWTVRPDNAALYKGLFTVVALLTGLVILGALFGGAGLVNRLLASRPAVALGKISYALYLWHYAVFFVIHDHAASWPAWAKVTVAATVPLALSTASYWLVEKPFLRLKPRRRAPKPAHPVGPPELLGTEPAVS